MFTFPVSSVVVPVDFSKASLGALKTAAGLLAPGGELHVVHVLPLPMYGSPGVLWNEIDDTARIAHAREALESELARIGVEGRLHVQVSDSPAWEIVDRAEKLGADLIVIPTHGRTGLARFAMGSISERVVRRAPCPTLVLRDHED